MGCLSKKKADEEQQEEKQPKPEKPKSVGYHKLFRFASGMDLLLWFSAMLCAAGQGFCQVYIIVLFGDVLNELALEDESKSTELVKWMCYIGIVCIVTGWVQYTFANISAERQKAKLRLAYLSAVIHQDVEWFDLNTPGTLPERISTNIEKMAGGMGDKVATFVMDLAMLLSGFAFGFYYWWMLSLVILGIVPLMAVGALLMGQAMTDLQNENQSWYGAAGACAEEVMFALRTVVAFRGEGVEMERYSGYLKKARRGGVIAQIKVGLGMGYMQAIMFGAYGVCFWLSAVLMANGEKKPDGSPYLGGDVIKVFFCVIFGGFALGMMGEPGTAIASACSAGAAFYEVLDNKPKIESRKGEDDAGAAVTSIEKISFQNVHFSYPARPEAKVLQGTSLTIEAGQRVALVGESGSGKSTIISLIERFYDADEAGGRVLVNGQDIRGLSTRSLRSVIGYVGQEPVLFATSIRANILHGKPEATEEELQEAKNQAQLDGFVSKMTNGLDTFVGSGGSQFSGGQKQRIAIARALIKKPSLLLLDEATSALDYTNEKMVQATLDQLGSAESSSAALTTIEIAHRLSTVMHRDVIFVMQKGKVVEYGKHEELMENKSVYHSLVASQQATLSKRPSQRMGELAGGEEAKAGEVAATAPAAKKEEAKGPVQPAEDAEEDEKKILKTYSAPLGRIFAFCKPEWIFVVPGIFGAILFGAKEPVLSWVLFDALVAFFNPDLDKMKEEVTKESVYFYIIALGTFIGGVLQFACFGVMKEGLTMRMRSATMTHLMRMEVGYHDDPDHTPSKNVFALEMYAFRAGNMMTAIGAYASVFGALAVGLVLGFIESWRMSLVVLGTIPAMAASQAVTMRVMMSGKGSTTEELKAAQQTISDSLNSIRTVRALGAEDKVVGLVGDRSLPVQQRAVKASFIIGFAFGVSQGIIFFVFALAMWFALYLIRNNHNTFSEAMRAQGCILFGAMGMGQAMSMVGNAAQAKMACYNLFKLLDRVSLIDGLKPTGQTPDDKVDKIGQVEFQDVEFFYPFREDVQVLKGITFTISDGQSVGLCGPSGGGKSTILALMQRFYDPQEGGIFVTGSRLPLASVDISWWRAQIGYIGQEPILFDTTVRENVLYATDRDSVKEEELEKCAEMACLGFLKEQDGWATKVGPRGERLSGGQKQRVAICRAIVRNPRILLMDEATSALDSASEQAVQEALNNVMASRTSFTIAHRLSTIEKCSVILACAEGKIAEMGTHEELMEQNGVYAKLQRAADSTATEANNAASA